MTPAPLCHICLMRHITLIILILLLGLGATIGYGVCFWRTPYSDAAEYAALGRSLASDGRFQDKSGQATSYRPPGYPFLIAFCNTISDDIEVILPIVQGLLVCATALMAVLTMRPFFSPRSRRWLLLLGVVCPTTLVYVSMAMSETLAMFLIVVAVYMIHLHDKMIDHGISWCWAVVGGLALGSAILVRPAALFLLPGLVLWMVWRLVAGPRRLVRVITTVMIAVAALTVVLPWSFRNQRIHGQFVLVSTNGAINLALANSPGARGGWRSFGQLGIEEEAGELEKAQRAHKLAFDFIKQHPVEYLQLCARRAAHWLSPSLMSDAQWLLLADEQAEQEIVQRYYDKKQGQAGALSERLKLILAANVALLTMWESIVVYLAVLGIYRAICTRQLQMVLALLLSFALFSSLTFMDARIRQTVIPLILIFTILGASSIMWYVQRWNGGVVARWSMFIPPLLLLPSTVYTLLQLLQTIGANR